MKNKILLTLSFMMLIISMLQAQKVKIGHVDADAVYRKMVEVKNADSLINQFSKSLQAEAKKMQDEYNGKYQEYQKNEATMEDFLKKSKMDELKSIEERFQKFQISGQEEMLKKQKELYGPINDKYKKALKAVAEKNGYKYILDEKNILYFDESDDVTKLLEQELGIK